MRAGAEAAVPQNSKDTERIQMAIVEVNVPQLSESVAEATMLQWKKKGTEIYQALPADLHNTLKPCEPLTSVPKFRKPQAEFFHTWKTVKK